MSEDDEVPSTMAEKHVSRHRYMQYRQIVKRIAKSSTMNSTMRIITILLLLAICGTSAFSVAKKPNVLERILLQLGRGKKLREQVVERYFDGVRQQNREQIVSCFPESGTKIRDVCGVSKSERLATPTQLGDRCMEFLAAHPDTKVMFHYPPTCGRGSTRWVFAHWYEEGTWKGESEGIEPEMTPLDVEGQTRFLVNDDLKITEMVVTRTFCDWEKKKGQKDKQ